MADHNDSVYIKLLEILEQDIEKAAEMRKEALALGLTPLEAITKSFDWFVEERKQMN